MDDMEAVAYNFQIGQGSEDVLDAQHDEKPFGGEGQDSSSRTITEFNKDRISTINGSPNNEANQGVNDVNIAKENHWSSSKRTLSDVLVGKEHPFIEKESNVDETNTKTGSWQNQTKN